VVVDEAAQATEVDSLKALAFAGSHTRVLLAGDHMQLGPIVASRRAMDLQFHVSLMQRLVALDAYRQPGMCSCLSVNYRSHPALIAVPSFLFYANSIRCAVQAAPAVGDPAAASSSSPAAAAQLCDWPGLPRRDFPLMFYGVAGIDSSPDGHGVRNSAEAKSLLFLVSKLLEDVPTLSQSDIGVMAPFRLQVASHDISNCAPCMTGFVPLTHYCFPVLFPPLTHCAAQVRLVRAMFRSANLRDVKVGTVDDYQGQEGKVIFLSATVSRRYGFADMSGEAAAVSFIGNPQRFNVALSRAQHMMVVVGDPWVLNMDRCARARARVVGRAHPAESILFMISPLDFHYCFAGVGERCCVTASATMRTLL
jgi:superfamily I DNA and/or RNA helicase